jgi:hypothetical protein
MQQHSGCTSHDEIVRMDMMRRYLAPLAVTLAGLLALVGCAGTSGGQGGGTTLATATPAPKATPTGVPTLSDAYCQGLMSVAEANQIMQPATPATTIRVDKGPKGGSCNYEYALFKPVVSVLFLPFQPGASLDAIATQSLAEVQAQPGANFTKTPVSGVGDQGLYISGTAQIGKGLWEDLLDTTDGPVFISCNVIGTGAPPTASLQAPLMQVCQQVISRL